MASIFDPPAAGDAGTGAPIDAGARALGGHLAAGYFGLQAVAGVALWVLVANVDGVRDAFEVLDDHVAVTDGFRLADLTVAVVASALAGVGLLRRRSWGVAAAGAALGSVAYPTAWLVWWVPAEGTGEVALALMVLVTAASAGALALAVRADR